MEENWERTAEFIRPDKNEASQIFARFDSSLYVSDLAPVSRGCRNSNYIAVTPGGKFFVRFSPDNRRAGNEKAALTLLGKKINMPQLLYCARNKYRTVFIYEYVDSVPLDDFIAQNGTIPEDIIRQAARSAALIHNETPPAGLFFQEDIPPFFTWYGYFLSQPYVRKRLGTPLAARLEKYIQAQSVSLEKIESDKVLIHCDFKTANMLITPRGQLCITDWEFAGNGHRVSDIGQFFRYKTHFLPGSRRTFEKEYNAVSNTGLAKNWYSLCRLRDLANLLEMISRQENAPVKFADIGQTVQAILDETAGLS